MSFFGTWYLREFWGSMFRSDETVLYPGSFDPFTHGHADLALRAKEKYARVIVGVAANPDKKGAFSPQERVRLAQRALGSSDMDPLDVVRVPGSVARWAQRNGINTIIRGVRNQTDKEAEKQLEALYRMEHPLMDLKKYRAKKQLEFASSSAAKSLVKANHDPSKIISLGVQEALASRLLSQYPVFITGGMGAGKSTVAKKMEEEARKYGIPTKYIELDKIGHAIYDSLTDPIYVEARKKLAETFGDGVRGENGWIDRKALRKALSHVSGWLDPEKLRKLDEIMTPTIEFRYRDIIEGFSGIIFVDGITKETSSFSRLAHHNAMIVMAETEDRVGRLMKRYEWIWDPVEEGFVRGIIAKQPTEDELSDIFSRRISESSNGSVGMIDNSGSSFDARKSFLRMLNQIDTYGELRATYVLQTIGFKGDIMEQIRHLQMVYNSDHRAYHTWEHIVESLGHLFDMAVEMDLPDEEIAIIGAAILWHDYVYEVNTQYYAENEDNSARIAGEQLAKGWVDRHKIWEVRKLILETQHGRAQLPDNPRSHVMHDADMAIIGASLNRYRLYSADVRTEFYPMLSGIAFEQARHDKFLVPVLEAGVGLYKTEYGQKKWGPQVERNVRWEMAGRETVRQEQ